MRSETRANLIFLIVLAIFMSPGAFIVTKKLFYGPPKKLRPLEPPPVRTESPFMNPILAASALEPVTPPRTGQYVLSLAKRLETMQPNLKSLITKPDFVATMSAGYNLQLLGTGIDDDQTCVALLGWNRDFIPLPSLYRFTAKTESGQTVEGKVAYYEQKNMDFDIREELREYGWIIPTDSTVWLIVRFATTEPIKSLDLNFTMEQKQIVDQLVISGRPTERLTSQPATLQ